MRRSKLRDRGHARIGLIVGCGALAAGILLIASSITRAQENGGPVVTVTGGQIQGRLLPGPGGAVFKGIPYAAPPTANFRWREPQPVKAWESMLQAAEYGADCPAVPGGIEYRAAFGGTLNQGNPPAPAAAPDSGRSRTPKSEDCLFLNVWTPQWPSTSKKAVMVWFHGGELAGGTGRLRSGPAEQAESSLARNGVVVVSVNFRGHLLGMMGHPELTAESPHHASGNYLLLDQIAALKWVHDNIGRFGGDPANVTIFGQSGGGRSVSMLVASPLSKGLVQRAIIESGSPMESTRPYLTKGELEKIGLALGQTLKAPSGGEIPYLRSLPASEIAAALGEVRRRLDEQNLLAFDEGIDGYVTPDSPAMIFRSHKELPIPLMVGNTAHDSGTVNGGMPWHPGSSPEEGKAWVKAMLQVFYAKYPDLLDQALKAYGFNGAPTEVVTYPPYGTLPQQVGTDLNHRCGVKATALWHSALAPTYQFEFSRATPEHPAVHIAELPFVFGYLSDEDLKDPNALKLRHQVQAYWTNFAKTGDPNGPGLPVWSKYDGATKPSMEFVNDGAVARTAARAAACAPYIEKFTREPDLMVGGEHAQLRGGNVR